MKKNKIIITGCAGFIGYHLSLNLLRDFFVIGIDSVNNYYDVKIKKQRLNKLKEHKNFKFFKINLTDQSRLEKLFRIEKFDFGSFSQNLAHFLRKDLMKMLVICLKCFFHLIF